MPSAPAPERCDWVGEVRLIDSTLREGLQFARFAPGLDDKRRLAQRLAAFGVDLIEIANPVGSAWARRDARALAALDLGGTRLAAHVRCLHDDVRAAIEAGVTVLHLFVPPIERLRGGGRLRSPEALIAHAAEVVGFARAQCPEVEIRLTPEDTFRTPAADVSAIFTRLAALGVVDRLGVADTVGAAHPIDVERLVHWLCAVSQVPIGFHGHDDTGCAVANALVAARAGAEYVDTAVLGLGERNGITSLEGFVAGLLAADAEVCVARFQLEQLGEIVADVARVAGMPIPPRTCLVGPHAFTHKAGVHIHAVLDQPSSYEFVDPALLDRDRVLLTVHELTGWHAVQAWAGEKGITLDQGRAREVAAWVRDASAGGGVTADAVTRRLREITGGPAPMVEPPAACVSSSSPSST